MQQHRAIIFFFLIAALGLGLIGFRHDLPMLDAIEGQVVAGSFRFFVNPDFRTPCCLTYPPGFFYLSALLTGFYYLAGLFVGSFQDYYDFFAQMLINPTPLTLIARGVSLLSFTLFVVLLFLLGEKMFGRRAGILAGLLALSTPSLIEFSKLGQMEMLMLLLGTASMWFAYQVLKTGRISDIFLAGAFAALATSLKYNGAVFILPAFVAILFLKKRRIHYAIWLTLAFGITGLILHPYIPRIVLSRYFFDLVRINPSFAIDQLFPPGFLTLVSYLTSGDPQKVVHGNVSLWAMWLIWLREQLIAILFLAGWLFAFIRRNREDWLLVFVPAALLLWTGRLRAFDTEFHYLLPFYPAAILMAAGLIGSLIDKVLIRFVPTKFSAILGIGILAIIVFPPMFREQIDFSKPTTIDVTRDWLAENAPPGSTIIRGPETPLRLTNPANSKIIEFSALPAPVQKQVNNYLRTNLVLVEKNFRYDLPAPDWPGDWTQEMINQAKKEPFVERLFRFAFLSVEEMKNQGAPYFVISEYERGKLERESWHEPGSTKDFLFNRERQAYREVLSSAQLELVQISSPGGSFRGDVIYIYKII